MCEGRLLGSLESQLCQMVFFWGRHVKEHFLNWTQVKGCYCIVELHLLGLHREKGTKNLLGVCCSFLLLLRTWADWHSGVS